MARREEGAYPLWSVTDEQRSHRSKGQVKLSRLFLPGSLGPLPPSGRRWKAFAIFKRDSFDPRLRTHKIHHLSSLYKRTIDAVRVEDDLRSIFYLDGRDIVSLDIGTHSIYRS